MYKACVEVSVFSFFHCPQRHLKKFLERSIRPSGGSEREIKIRNEKFIKSVIASKEPLSETVLCPFYFCFLVSAILRTAFLGKFGNRIFSGPLGFVQNAVPEMHDEQWQKALVFTFIDQQHYEQCIFIGWIRAKTSNVYLN